MVPVHRILCPTDFSACAEHAFQYAAHWAALFHAELHVLHVAEIQQPALDIIAGDFASMPVMVSTQPEPSLGVRRELQKRLSNPGIRIVEAELHAYAAVDGILEYVEDHAIDLVVMGTHGRRGTSRLLMGSVAEEVVRRVSCPVCTIREAVSPAFRLEMKRILVPVDFSEHSREAVRVAKAWAAEEGAELLVLNVMEEVNLPGIYQLETSFVNTPATRARIEAELEEWVDDIEGPDVPVHTYARFGYPARTINEVVKNHSVDLIMMGTHSRTGLSRMLLGSVAEKVIRTAPCPVVALHAAAVPA